VCCPGEFGFDDLGEFDVAKSRWRTKALTISGRFEEAAR
jgi:hypothetical protein